MLYLTAILTTTLSFFLCLALRCVTGRPPEAVPSRQESR